MYEAAETDLKGEGAVQAVIDSLNCVNLYVGMRVEGNTLVTADGVELTPQHSQRRRNHSPAGFNWGYGGSGPAQLALAILLREGLPDDLAMALYQAFKWRYVARWDQADNWFLLGDELRKWIHSELTEVQEKQERCRGKEGDSA